jgi:pre-mRNA-splicing factor SYF1
MLRVKRSVVAQFNTDVSFIASQAVARQQQAQHQQNGDSGDLGGDDAPADDAMAALERQARAPMGFVAASTGPEGGQKKDILPQVVAPVKNADEIDMDDEDL